MRPEIYCEIVGLETPSALAISLLLFPEFSISALMFWLIISFKSLFVCKFVFSILKLY